MKYVFVFLLLTVSFLSKAQILTNAYFDPCSKQMVFYDVPIGGSVLIVYRSSARSFSYAEAAKGDVQLWVNEQMKTYVCKAQEAVQQTQTQTMSDIVRQISRK